MSIGWGIIYANSGKQRLHTKISTEAEILGVSDYLKFNIQLVIL